MGSARHAKLLRSQGADLRFALSLEMVGYFSEEPESQRFPARFPFRMAYPSTGSFALLLGDDSSRPLVRRLKAAFRGGSPIPVYSANVSRTLPGADFSDHRSFWEAGYPAFMLTDTAYLRNPHYHSATDLPETLDYVRMAQLVDGTAAMLADACAE
jgi:hypothetical protein